MLTFSDGASLICTVQMYGGIMLFPEGANDNFYYLVGKEKPSPLTAEFDQAYFDRLVSQAKPGLSVKAFLATEQRIPGLGNGCLQDILFNAAIHPQSRLSALGDKELAVLYRQLKATLRTMADAGGRDTEKDLFGMPWGYTTLLSNKTAGRPCPICGGAIIRKAYLGGNVYFCPACQPLRK